MSERIEFTGITGFALVAVLCMGLGVAVFLIVLGVGLLVWSWT